MFEATFKPDNGEPAAIFCCALVSVPRHSPPPHVAFLVAKVLLHCNQRNIFLRTHLSKAFIVITHTRESDVLTQVP